MSTVTVEAIRPVAINHFLLYPGERRAVLAGLAQELAAAGHVRLIEPPVPVDPPAPAAPAPEPTPKRSKRGRAA